MGSSSTTVGLILKLAPRYCLTAVASSSNFYSVFEAELADVIPVIHTTIAGTRIVGRLCAGEFERFLRDAGLVGAVRRRRREEWGIGEGGSGRWSVEEKITADLSMRTGRASSEAAYIRQSHSQTCPIAHCPRESPWSPSPIHHDRPRAATSAQLAACRSGDSARGRATISSGQRHCM